MCWGGLRRLPVANDYFVWSPLVVPVALQHPEYLCDCALDGVFGAGFATPRGRPPNEQQLRRNDDALSLTRP